MWANETLRQLQSNPPWTGWVSEEIKQQYIDAGWKEVGVDYELPIDETKATEQFNANVKQQISQLESLLIRPMRELLSTAVADKSFAQAKVDDIETQIQALRAQLK